MRAKLTGVGLACILGACAVLLAGYTTLGIGVMLAGAVCIVIVVSTGGGP